MLYLAFWMLPMQRWCTVVGLGVMAGLGGTLYSPSTISARLTGWGFLIGMTPLAAGRRFWRALTAPRAVSLAPRGRLRVLLGVVVVAAVIPLAVVVCAALFSLGACPVLQLCTTQSYPRRWQASAWCCFPCR